MSLLINFLPWRQTLRQKLVRQWGLWGGLVLLLIPLLMVSIRQLSAWQLTQRQSQSEYLASMLSALQTLYQQRLELLEQNKKLQQMQQLRDQQQQAIQDWEKRLIQLAASLPSGSWLTSINFYQGLFAIKGHAKALEDMQKLEKQLALLEGVTAVKAGALQHEDPAGFGFAFTLKLAGGLNVMAH